MIGHTTVRHVLGKRLQERRKKLRITQAELASLLGITRVYIGYIEQGRENPSLRLLVSLSNMLEIKLYTLFEGL